MNTDQILTQVLKQMQQLTDCIRLLISIHCTLKLAVPKLSSVLHSVQAGKEFNGPHEFMAHFPHLNKVGKLDTGML